MDHHIADVLASILIVGITLQWLGWRLRIPGLILLIIAGVIMGPVTGWLKPDSLFGDLLQPMISLSVAVILFEGGLNLHWHEFRANWRIINRLVTWAVVISFSLASLAAHYLVGMAWPVALTLGAITIVTGPTVIMPLLKQARLKKRPAALLRWEGIVNDPTGALLAVLIYSYYVNASDGSLLGGIVSGMLLSLGVSLVLGVGFGMGLGYLFRRSWVPEHLKPPLILVVVLLVASLANAVQSEAGLLAATILGITLANLRLGAMDELMRFKEYVTILLVSATFIVLTANIQPEIMTQLDWHSWLLLFLLIFVIRPVAIYLSTIKSGITWQERVLVGWIAPRGIVAAAVAGLFGAQLAQQGYAGAELLLPLIFALIVITVTLHGLSIGWLGKKLDLAASSKEGVLIVGATPWSVSLATILNKHNIPVLVNDSSWAHLRPARMQNLPTHYGEILSEQAEEVVELSYITRLLALTDNEAYNTLVCSHYAPELGYRKVRQIAWQKQGSDDADDKAPKKALRGYSEFGDGLLFNDFQQTFAEGWRFESTRLSEEFTFEQFKQQRPDSHLIALINPEGRLAWYPWKTMKPGNNYVVISYSPAADEAF